MIDRRTLMASVPAGPREPRAETPPRRPGSVRRTTAIEQGWDDDGRPLDVVASGRDLITGLDGSATVHDQAALRLSVDELGLVTAIETEPAHPALAGLIGGGMRSGFRARAAELVPEHRDRATVLHQLLDDVPLAALIVNYGITREQPAWNIPLESVVRMSDLCAGWAAGATMLDTLERTGVFPLPFGPEAPSLLVDGDPLAWHDLGPIPTRTVRRVRRLDLARGAVPGDPLELEVYFRDSHLSLEGPEDVLHEYTVRATLEPATLVLLDVVAEAHTLPWPECPAARASAGWVVGRTPGELPAVVKGELTGTGTCSHLNDVLRSMAGVGAMAEELP